MPSHIENGIAYLNGLKVGDIYGSNYIRVSNTGVMTLTGTATIVDGSATVENFKSINIAYDTSNYFQFSVGSTGAGKITTVGSADSFEIETGDGKIILDAKTDIDIDPEGNDINLLGSGAGKITLAATTMSIFGGDTTGDALILQGNSADATEKITITGATGTTVGGLLTSSNGVVISALATSSGFGLTAGTTGAKLSLANATDRLINAFSTSSLAAGNVVSMTLSQTMTGASATNTVELAQFVLTSDVQVGNWANAVLAKIDFSTNGYVTGLAGVVCAELDLPGSTIPGGAGTYSCFEAEINCPTSYEGNAPIHVFQINAWGAAVTEFDDNGYLFDITGVTSGATGVWYDNQKAAPAVEEFIRVKTPSGVRYLALYDANV